jgi:hypothetical protein
LTTAAGTGGRIAPEVFTLRTTCAILAAVAALAGGGPATAGALPDSGELDCKRAFLGECSYTDPASGLLFDWPVDWPARHLRLVTETGPAARARQRDALRWIAIEYLPDDASQPEVALFRVAVLRRSDWLLLSAQPAPADAVEVATGPDHVAVATVPPANPYPPGSRDAEIFEALLPSPAQISRMVNFPGRR